MIIDYEEVYKMNEKFHTVLRVLVGWVLFQGGIEKVLDSEWTAAGYLNNAVAEGNPLIPLWTMLAGNPLVDILVAWGLTLGGIAIIFGLYFKWAAYLSSVLLFLFWLSYLQGGLFKGLPLEHGWVVSEHIVYIALLLYLANGNYGKKILSKE